MTLTFTRSLLLFAVSTLLPVGAFAQEDYVSRFDAYAGFAYFESPAINLPERGYHVQFGYNLRTWLAAGFDYSNANGTLALIPAYLPTPLMTTVDTLFSGLEAAGALPPGYNESVSTSVFTQTFAAGPTLVYRRFKHIGLLIHPSLGAVREVATPHPNDPLKVALVATLIPGPTKLDWQGFYGFGGGIDFGVTKYVGIRMQTDLVYDHLFNDLLRNGRWTVRASVGPSFHFGHNIKH